MKTHFSKTQGGFSIIETLIAAFVLTIGLVAALQVFGPAIRTGADNRDRSIAAMLAQEGIELAKNHRDNNMVDGVAFADGLDAGTYCIDYTGIAGCNNDGALSIDGNNLYAHVASGAATGFKRKVHTVATSTTLTIRSYVTWADGTFPSALTNPTACTLARRCVFSETTLTNWK